MAISGLNKITVWLDELAPGQGTFAHALDWATMLHLPLHALVPVGRNGWPLPAETIAACASACSWNGVSWNYSHQDPNRNFDPDAKRGDSDGLLVMGGAIPVGLQRRLFREAIHRPQIGPLLCSRSWEYLRRILVVNEGRSPGCGFLEAVARICSDLSAPVAVLTVAHADEDARHRQQLAEEVFAAHGVRADFHVVVGSDVSSAISVVGNWRRCSHVFVEKIAASPMRRLLGRRMGDQVLELSDTFSFLPIPGTGLVNGGAAQDEAIERALSAAAAGG